MRFLSLPQTASAARYPKCHLYMYPCFPENMPLHNWHAQHWASSVRKQNITLSGLSHADVWSVLPFWPESSSGILWQERVRGLPWASYITTYFNHLWPNPIPKTFPSLSLHHGNTIYTIASHEHLNYNCAHVHSFMKLFIISHFQSFFMWIPLDRLIKEGSFTSSSFVFSHIIPTNSINLSTELLVRFLWFLNVFSEIC